MNFQAHIHTQHRHYNVNRIRVCMNTFNGYILFFSCTLYRMIRPFVYDSIYKYFTCRKATQKSYIKLWIPKRSPIPCFFFCLSSNFVICTRIYVCDDSTEARDVRESFKHHTWYLYTIPYSQVSEGRCVVTCVTIPKRSHPYALQDCFYWNLWLYASTIFSDPYFASFLFQFSLDIVNVVVPFIVCWIFLGLFHLRSRYGLYFVEVIYIHSFANWI